MSRREGKLTFDIRPYRPDDEAQVLDLLGEALGAGPTGSRTPEFFRWKHEDGPAGPSFMLVAEIGDRIVGLRAFMRWRLTAGMGALRAVSAVDTATHPRYQGLGIFSALTRTALDSLRDDADLVFNTPNEKSGPGYVKMGWRIVGRLPVAVHPRRPLRFAASVRSLRSAETPSRRPPSVGGEAVAEALADERIHELLRDADRNDPRIRTVRDLDYLRWRYVSVPGLEYRAVRLGKRRLEGLGIFRIRPRGRLWEGSIVEALAPQDDPSLYARVLRAAAAATNADHVTCSFARRTREASAARRAGYLRAPGGFTLAVMPLRQGIRPDPTSLDAWALTLGDLEVF